MNEIIKVEAVSIGDANVRTVNARELHLFLESGQEFRHWIKDRIEQYEFAEGADFTTSEKIIRGGRAIEYHISLDMAKELAMVERTDKGREARRYFIECERKAAGSVSKIRSAAPRIASPHRESVALSKQGYSLCTLYGFTGNQAILFADKFATGATGISPLALMGATHLIADQRGMTLTPTQLGSTRGMSAQAMNKYLFEQGLQRPSDAGTGWEPTEKAAGHYEWLDTGKVHNTTGTPVKQLKWFASVADLFVDLDQPSLI